MEEHVIEIRDDLKADVRKLAMLIQHHEGIVQSMRAEMSQILRLAHGVTWPHPQTILDAEGGVVVQRTPAVVEAAPAAPERVVEADSK